MLSPPLSMLSKVEILIIVVRNPTNLFVDEVDKELGFRFGDPGSSPLVGETIGVVGSIKSWLASS